MNAMIMCNDGLCQVMSYNEMMESLSLAEEEEEKEKARRKKKKKGKKKKKKRTKKTIEDLEEVPRPLEGEDTVILDQEQMKHALPQVKDIISI